MLEKKAKLRPEWKDCCPNSCMAYTGKYENETSCSTLLKTSKTQVCGEPRYHSKKNRKGQLVPRKRWLYLPLVPRLRRLFKSDLAQVLTTYRTSFHDVRRREMGKREDVFDGDLYQNFHRGELGLFTQ